MIADADDETTSTTMTILGFGSLLSERSSRLTFPELINFRLARVPGYRRVFGHPASIFFQRGIANLQTKEMSSLAVEHVGDNEIYRGMVVAAFEVSSAGMMKKDGVPSRAFLEREEEFNIIQVPFTTLDGKAVEGMGVICTKSSDEAYIERWGQERFDQHYKQYGIDTIWGWKPDSGLRPCAVYLRHCYLAAQAAGEDCFNSFLDDTYLVDRTTTIREYMQQYPEILETKPPPELADRYCG